MRLPVFSREFGTNFVEETVLAIVRRRERSACRVARDHVDRFGAGLRRKSITCVALTAKGHSVLGTRVGLPAGVKVSATKSAFPGIASMACSVVPSWPADDCEHFPLMPVARLDLGHQ